MVAVAATHFCPRCGTRRGGNGTYLPDLSPAIADAVLRALEKDPARRFPSAADMASALRAVCGACDRDAVAAQVAARANTARAPIKPPILEAATRDEGPTKNERPRVGATREESRPIAPARRGRRLLVAAVGGAIAIGAGVGVVMTRDDAAKPQPIVEQRAIDAAPHVVEQAPALAPALPAAPDAAAPVATSKSRGPKTTSRPPPRDAAPAAAPDATPIDAPSGSGSGSGRRKDNPFSTP